MATLLAILQLIPAIIALVRQIEEAVPGTGKGEAKLNLVLDSVNVVAAEIPELANQAVTLQKAVTGIVKAVVTMLNTTGVFKKV